MTRKKYSTAPRARRPRVAPETITGPVYLASPLSTYRTPRYGAMVSRARAHFPDAEIVPARDAFRDRGDWLARWPGILPTLAAVVVFADENGWIGAGVWAEVHDARRHGVPVYVLDDAGGLRRWESVRVTERRPDDWDRTARLDLPFLEPHSPAWLAALAGADPLRAAYVAAVLGAGGRVEGCSVCGDGPARDYVLDDFPIPERFCDFCRDAQAEMRGATARPLVGVNGARDG